MICALFARIDFYALAVFLCVDSMQIGNIEHRSSSGTALVPNVPVQLQGILLDIVGK